MQSIRRNISFCSLIALLISCDCFVTSLSALAAEKPELTRLLPAGMQSNKATTVTATGKFPVWPLTVWCDTDQISWKPLEKAGEFEVMVSDSAVPGVHWIRLYEPNGATVIKPFIVGKLTESLEVEPNDQNSQVQPLSSLPITINGVLEKAGDIDLVAVELKKGQSIFASVVANEHLKSPVDMCIQVVSDKGVVLDQNHDQLGLDPAIRFQASQDGVVSFRLFGFPESPDSTIGYAGRNDFVYRLTIADQIENIPTPFDPVDQSAGMKAIAIESSSRENPVVIELPCSVTGTLKNPKQQDYLRFHSAKDVSWAIDLHGRSIGSAIDGVVIVKNTEGKVLLEKDDSDKVADPRFVWKSPADADYLIAIKDLYGFFGEDYFYRIDIQSPQPDYELTLNADLVQGEVGKEIEIPVNIQRKNDFNDEIQISVEGLQETVQAPPVISKKGDETAKLVKLKLTVTAPLQSALRIIGRPEKQDNAPGSPVSSTTPAPAEPSTTTVPVTPLIDFTRTASGPQSQQHVWLSVTSP